MQFLRAQGWDVNRVHNIHRWIRMIRDVSSTFFQPFLIILVQPSCGQRLTNQVNWISPFWCERSNPCFLHYQLAGGSKWDNEGYVHLRHPSFKTSHSGQMTSWTGLTFLFFRGIGEILRNFGNFIPGWWKRGLFYQLKVDIGCPVVPPSQVASHHQDDMTWL